MKRLFVSILALSLAAATATASAQSYGYGSSDYGRPSPDRYGQSGGAQYDYARVLRVDPVFDSRSGYGYNGSGYNNSSYNNQGYSQTSNGQRCYEDRSYVNGSDPYYGNGSDGYSGNDGYRQNDGYYDQYGNRRTTGSQGGSTMATVIGGVVGAVIGSQVGGGSARYATSAIGTMVGGVAGRQIYEQTQRQRNRTGTVRVCDPVPANGRYTSNGYASNDRSVNAYDVTYEYAGRTYTTRTNYHPGNRIRVRVDVRPE